NRRHHPHRIAGRAHGDGHEGTALLTDGQVVLYPPLRIETFVRRVAYHAHDRDPRGICAATTRTEGDALADRLLIREVFLYELVIDDRDLRRSLRILVGEEAAALEWNAQRLEEARTHDADVPPRTVLA